MMAMGNAPWTWNAAAAADQTALQIRDLTFVVHRCVKENGRMSSMIERSIAKKPAPQECTIHAPSKDLKEISRTRLPSRVNHLG